MVNLMFYIILFKLNNHHPMQPRESSELVIHCKKSPIVNVFYHDEDPQQIYIVSLRSASAKRKIVL